MTGDVLQSHVFRTFFVNARLDEREGLVGEGRLDGEDAGDRKHSQTAVLDLGHSVSLEVLGVLAQAQGIEFEFSGHAARALALLVQSHTTDQLQHGGDEHEPAENGRRADKA